MEINRASVVRELIAHAESYERALIDNDVETLKSYFWQSPDTIRFGVTEELYGAEEITRFRDSRVIDFSNRKTIRTTALSFGEQFGVTTLEFSVLVEGKRKHGRQSQVWARLNGDWKVVSAHVSHRVAPSGVEATYVDAASSLTGLPLQPEFAEGVAENLATIAEIAAPLMAFDLDDDVEAAPVSGP